MNYELTDRDCIQASVVCHKTLARHSTASRQDDIVQECLLDLLTLAERWNKDVAPSFPKWAGAEMCRHARWRLLDTLKAEGRIQHGELGYKKLPPPDPAEQAEVADLARLALLACSNDKQRRVIALLIEGYDGAAAAAMLGITADLATYHARQARPLIAKAFASHAGYDESSLLRQG